ncbi:hypothetical protein LHJ74_32090 [Streptomyces sp. N2-109]|uniref:Uncharacterized protein n=1 Tax=Streptomyces gossypii TaxID=2883101 RepID=A0ABT2K327_9ACTN|nr:hypothetical protein [Streptomyces gossypii]MCT2594496.1 hypothetical protein [Streptomyces gossypii]
MDQHDPIAKRFPLIARFRPACLPLPDRVQNMVDLAAKGLGQSDQGLASAVYNQSALIASDLGLPELAREMCHQHAAAYLHSSPLPAMSAIRALEPVVNLARLQIRAGRTDDARRRLLDLYEAVDSGAAAVFEGIAVPAGLTATSEDRQEVRAWLWRVLLADGTRTLTTTGRWSEALAHIEKHRGVGMRMLDGRQVAVLAALTTGDTERADGLLADTAAGDPWEQIVTTCLVALCRREAGQPVDDHLTELVEIYLGREAEAGFTVFDIRLGLTVLDAIGSADHAASSRLAERLVHRTTEARDGYAAREILGHPLAVALTTERQAQNCEEVVRVCALGAGTVPAELHSDLSAALRTSEAVITRSLTAVGER